MKTISQFRNWQIEAFQLGRTAQNFLIQAPGGSGKSLFQVALAQADIIDTGNKQLILVPKNHIHHGFFDEEAIQFTLPGETKPTRWTVQSNFCTASKVDPKTLLLKEFLLSDVRSLRRKRKLAAIATHKAMVSVWAILSRKEKLQALRNISFRIDEAHHVSDVFHDADLELFNVKDRKEIERDGTRLGKFVQYALRNGDDTLKVHLATATFFRGDRRTILSERFKQEFAHYYLPWDEHFQTLGIDHLSFDFINYRDDPLDEVIDLIEREQKDRHLIILPALTHRYRTNETLPRLLGKLRMIFPDRRILDLVTPELQARNKLLLHQDPDRFGVVVACRLFDEGTDWVPCTRMHNTDACETSVTLAVQRFFRPLRAHPSKNRVRIFNYLPGLSEEMSVEEKRCVLSNRLNAFLACIVTQGELRPCLVPVKNAPKGTKPRKSKSLQEIYAGDYPDLLEELIKRYECVEDKNDSSEIEAIADKIISTYGVPDDVEPNDLKRALLRQLIRIANPKSKTLDQKSLEPEGIDAESIRRQGFDKVWQKVSLASSVICHGTENLDAASIRELLSIVNEIPSLKEIHDGIRIYHKRTGQRPTFHQSEWLAELNRSASAVDKVLRRHCGTTLAQEVRGVLGDANDDLIARTHELIREYWSKGIRLGNKYGDIPEIGMTSFALNGRLTWNHKTTLAKEVEKVLGPKTKPLTLPKIKSVVQIYQRKGIRLHRKFGRIPELDMSSYNLADRLQRNFKVKLSELVDEVANRNSR